MRLLIAVYFSAASCDSFIKLRDKEFLGEDSQIAEILRHRIEDVRMPPPPSHENFADTFMHNIDQLDAIEVRRNTRRNWRFPKEPDDKELKARSMELMQHMIYATQYRLEDLQQIINKYSNEPSFRAAFVFCRLDTILSDLMIMLSRINNTIAEKHKTPSNRIYTHLIYYNYFLKKNTDITYIVEYMIKFHTERMKPLNFVKEHGLKRQTRLPPGNWTTPKGFGPGYTPPDQPEGYPAVPGGPPPGNADMAPPQDEEEPSPPEGEKPSPPEEDKPSPPEEEKPSPPEAEKPSPPPPE